MESLLRVCAVVVPALPESVSSLRRLVRREAKRWLLSGEAQDALQLVVSELAGNVVLHSGSPYVALLLRVEMGVLTVKIRDGGRWGGRSAVVKREDGDCCGRGLTLVGAVVSRFAVVRTPGGTEVVAELDLPATVVPARRQTEECLELTPA
ncbi:ATP-binding protein [Streptomyces sp. NBC_00435]|uniref:ATP-binding protein n=1 Tax=Streptomyces sp. NBC_00435 TaxID=2903649 RepID=UPI002E24C119